MKDYWYHHKEWLGFWYVNMNDTYGVDFSEWCSPQELAEIWYENEEPEDYTEKDKEITAWYSAGVFIGQIQLD